MEKGEPFALLVGMQTGAATVESSMEIPQNIKNGSAFWSSNPISGNIPEGTWNTNLKEHKHPFVHCRVIYICQDMEKPRCPSVDEWIKQLWDIYTMGCCLAIKRSKFYPLWQYGWTGEHYAKWNKPVRERQIPYDFTHMWNLMNKLN